MAHIDTFKYFQNLRDSGVPENQAAAQVQALIDTMNGLATKEELKFEIDLLKKDLKQEIQIEIQNLKYFFIKSIVVLIYAPLIVAAALRWFGKI